MPANIKIDEEHEFFSANQIDDIVIIRFREKLLMHVSNLSDRDIIIDYFDRLSVCSSIKAVILYSSPEQEGCEQYKQFFKKIKPNWDRIDIYRLCNIVNQLILKIVDLNKIVIHVNSGQIISLFMNISLACDYRIVSEDTVFCNPYLDIGLVPKGGGPFFLSKMVGIGKAYEILLLNKEITAPEALQLGIVNKIAPFRELEDTAMAVARNFAENHPSSIAGIKRLVQYSQRDLRNYLELENRQILRIIESPDFCS